MKMTTVKVPVELRDRLAEHARRDHTTLAETIARSLDAAETYEFWQDVRTTMGSGEARAQLRAESERLASTLADHVDPDESWDDVL